MWLFQLLPRDPERARLSSRTFHKSDKSKRHTDNKLSTNPQVVQYFLLTYETGEIFAVAEYYLTR